MSEHDTPRVSACIEAVMQRYPSDKSAVYFTAVHQALAPLARELEREAAELRAKLAKCEAQMLRMATCAGEFARDACVAQAPSAPVAPQTTDQAIKEWDSITDAVHSKSRAALSVKAEQRAAIHRRVLQNCEDGLDVVGPTVCTVPPPGWYCTRAPGHDGPCAAKRAAAPNPPQPGEA